MIKDQHYRSALDSALARCSSQAIIEIHDRLLGEGAPQDLLSYLHDAAIEAQVHEEETAGIDRRRWDELKKEKATDRLKKWRDKGEL